MSGKVLQGKRIAFLATDGFEQVELTEPWNEIKDAGAKVELVSLEPGRIQGVHHEKQGDLFDVDKTVDQVSAEDFDGLLLPDDLSAYCKKAIEEFAEGKHDGQNSKHEQIMATINGPATSDD